MEIADLLTLEHHGWESLCNSTGADFYGRIMLDDSVMVLAHGQVLDRQQVVASLNEAPAWSSYEISEARVIELDELSAVLVYRGRAWRGEGDPAFDALMSSVYVRLKGHWRLASYQQTPIPS